MTARIARSKLNTGAGEGNRTLVCSLGSYIVSNQIKRIAAKLGPMRPNRIKGLRRESKTAPSGPCGHDPQATTSRSRRQLMRHAYPSRDFEAVTLAVAQTTLSTPPCRQRRRSIGRIGHQTRSSADVCDTTASPPKADLPGSPSDVAEVPEDGVIGRRACG